MFLDVVQTPSHVQVSYFNKTGQINLINLPLPEGGYSNWEITHDNDPDADKQFRNHDGKAIKRKPGFRFYDLNLNEFLTKRIIPEHQELLHGYNKPNFFSVDIETEIRDEFPTPDKADKYQIYSFSITAPNLSTIVLSTKQCNIEKVREKVKDGMKIINLENLSFLDTLPIFPVEHFYFESEESMIIYFLEKIRQVLHVHGGWNYLYYDWPFIKNRCEHLKIDIGRYASPTGELTYRMIHNDILNKPEKVGGFPMHRMIVDYQKLYVQYSKKGYIESEKLDHIANIELGASKLHFPMTLKQLYTEDYDTFIAYAAIDTILVQLIHLKCNSVNILLTLAYFNKISVNVADGPIMQADAMMFEELYKDYKVIADRKEPNVKEEQYPGAFVKEPVRRVCNFPVCYDAKSLYPSTKKTFNISFELYRGKCKPAQVEELKSKGYVVTDRLSVYDQSQGPGIYKRLQTTLSDLRTLFKSCQLTIWSDFTKRLDDEAARRGIKIKKQK